jgi:spore coat polysaccharide biosynthesis protein SpsF
MKTVAIIQARMGSTRFPGKTLADVCGKPLLHYVSARVQRCPLLHEVVVATSTDEQDDAIADFCAREGIPCVRGDHDDVLTRYVKAAQVFQAETIVRLTGDCPLIDPEVIRLVIGEFQRGGYDYVNNVEPRTYPHGLDTEVFSRDALMRMDREARSPYDREHVTRYIRDNPEHFRIGSVTHDSNLSHHRFTVDHPEDLVLVQTIYDHFGGREDVSWLECVSAMEEHAGWQELNRRVAEKHVYT